MAGLLRVLGSGEGGEGVRMEMLLALGATVGALRTGGSLRCAEACSFAPLQETECTETTEPAGNGGSVRAPKQAPRTFKASNCWKGRGMLPGTWSFHFTRSPAVLCVLCALCGF